MIPLQRIGLVKEGPLKGWYIQAQAMNVPKGILVSRARNRDMDQTLVLDGIFPSEEKAMEFFMANAPAVDWEV